MQFSALKQQCQNTEWSKNGKTLTGPHIFVLHQLSIIHVKEKGVICMYMYTTALCWITAIMSRSPNLKMKQVTTVLVAGGRITVAHLRTRLRTSTTGNVRPKSGHGSDAVRPWQVLGSLQWTSCRKEVREFLRLMSGVLAEGHLPSPHQQGSLWERCKLP